MSTTVATTTAFRLELQAHLSEQLGVEFVGGPVGGLTGAGQENRDLGCVWLESKIPQGIDGNNELITYGVRLFRSWMQAQGDTETGRNVEQLEQDVELLQTAFRAVLLEAGHDFFNVAGVTPNYEGQYVEAALTAFQRNMGAQGG